MLAHFSKVPAHRCLSFCASFGCIDPCLSYSAGLLHKVDKTNHFFAAAVTSVIDACLQPISTHQVASGPGGGLDQWDNFWFTGEKAQQDLDLALHEAEAEARRSAARELANSGGDAAGIEYSSTAPGNVSSVDKDALHSDLLSHEILSHANWEFSGGGGVEAEEEEEVEARLTQKVQLLDPNILFGASVGAARDLPSALKLFRACSPHEVRVTLVRSLPLFDFSLAASADSG